MKISKCKCKLRKGNSSQSHGTRTTTRWCFEFYFGLFYSKNFDEILRRYQINGLTNITNSFQRIPYVVDTVVPLKNLQDLSSLSKGVKQFTNEIRIKANLEKFVLMNTFKQVDNATTPSEGHETLMATKIKYLGILFKRMELKAMLGYCN